MPSTNASSNERDDFEDEMDDNESMYLDDEDVRMSDVPSKKAKVVRKRKPKTVIPVGRNGLKKRKVTKTRKTKDGNGYFGEPYLVIANVVSYLCEYSQRRLFRLGVCG